MSTYTAIKLASIFHCGAAHVCTTLKKYNIEPIAKISGSLIFDRDAYNTLNIHFKQNILSEIDKKSSLTFENDCLSLNDNNANYDKHISIAKRKQILAKIGVKPLVINYLCEN